MPAHHRLGRDEAQLLAPAGTPSSSQDPEYLVPGVKPSAWSGSSWPSQDGELMAQEQILEHEVLARACPGQDGREQQPEQFEHAFSIADLHSAEVLPSDRPNPQVGNGPGHPVAYDLGVSRALAHTSLGVNSRPNWSYSGWICSSSR
jgi:hypothetical protein